MRYAFYFVFFYHINLPARHKFPDHPYVSKHLCTRIKRSKIHGLLTSSIFVAQVRKPPNIGQVHSEANDRKEKVYFLAPSFSLLRSGRTCAVARGGNDGGAGVLDTILVLHQYQFYLLFLHITLFQRGHRRELVFWHDLDIHLLWCVRSPRWPGALTAPCGFWRSRWSEACAWMRTPIPADKKRIRQCSPPKLQLIPPRTWAGEEGRETEGLQGFGCA